MIGKFSFIKMLGITTNKLKTIKVVEHFGAPISNRI